MILNLYRFILHVDVCQEKVQKRALQNSLFITNLYFGVKKCAFYEVFTCC